MPLRIHSSAIRYFDAVRRAKSIRKRRGNSMSLLPRSIARSSSLKRKSARHFSSGFQPACRSLRSAKSSLGTSCTSCRIWSVRVRYRCAAWRPRGPHYRSGCRKRGVPILPSVIDQVRERAPKMTFTVAVMGSFDIPLAITAGEADVGVAFALRKSSELQQAFLAQFRLAAVVRPDHPLAQHKAGICLPVLVFR